MKYFITILICMLFIFILPPAEALDQELYGQWDEAIDVIAEQHAVELMENYMVKQLSDEIMMINNRLWLENYLEAIENEKEQKAVERYRKGLERRKINV